MSRSENDIVKYIQSIAVAAVTAMDPTSVVYGTVTEADEETGEVAALQVDQQFVIDADQLIIPNAYRERTIEKIKIKGACIAKLREALAKLEIDWEPEEECEEDEALVDVTIKDFLKAGEPVILTRQQGGQKFIVTGRTYTDG